MYSDANIDKFLLGVSMQFIYRYWNQVHTKHENLFSIWLESEQKQDRE